MPKCSYCGQMYDIPRGLTLVDSFTGTVRYLCSSKCRKNFQMKRKKKKWAIIKKSKI